MGGVGKKCGCDWVPVVTLESAVGLSKGRDVMELAGHLENGQMISFSVCRSN